MGKYVFDRHFDGDDKKNEILAPFIDCHDPVRTNFRKPTIHIGSLNIRDSFQSKSVSIRSIVKQKVEKSLLTILRIMLFAEWPLDFHHAPGLSPCIVRSHRIWKC